MGARNVGGEEGCDVGIRRTIGKHTPEEAISERRRIGGEPLRPAESVALEAIRQNSQVFSLEPFADRPDVLGSDLETSGILERQ